MTARVLDRSLHPWNLSWSFTALDDEHRLLYLNCPPNLDLPKVIESRKPVSAGCATVG
jgi:hypothetical protein